MPRHDEPRAKSGMSKLLPLKVTSIDAAAIRVAHALEHRSFLAQRADQELLENELPPSHQARPTRKATVPAPPARPVVSVSRKSAPRGIARREPRVEREQGEKLWARVARADHGACPVRCAAERRCIRTCRGPGGCGIVTNGSSHGVDRAVGAGGAGAALESRLHPRAQVGEHAARSAPSAATPASGGSREVRGQPRRRSAARACSGGTRRSHGPDDTSVQCGAASGDGATDGGQRRVVVQPYRRALAFSAHELDAQASARGLRGRPPRPATPELE